MNQIVGPYVINLDHRTDRWDQVQAEFHHPSDIPLSIHRATGNRMYGFTFRNCINGLLRGTAMGV